MKKIVSLLILMAFPTFSQNIPLANDTIAVNNIIDWLRADGYDSFDPRNYNSGFYYYPGDSISMQTTYLEGLQWGGISDNIKYIGGTYYFEANLPLLIDSSTNSYSGIWKIRKDWESFPEGEFKSKLKHDYNNWPVELGAPWIDVNGDGVFTRGIDTPDFLGDEVLFYAYESADSSRFTESLAAQPYKVEVHVTVWGFNKTDFLRDVIFKRYEIINKGDKELNDFYVAYWADNDLGLSNDDYVGCDSSLFLAYTYNERETDAYFHPKNTAFGHVMLKGLETPEGNLMMTAFNPSLTNSPFNHDPLNVEEYYNMVSGKIFNGESYINPYTNQVTNFPFNGNPSTGEGWYEGGNWPNTDQFGDMVPPAGDRRYYLCSGPIKFSAEDTQTVVIAEFPAVGDGHLNVINDLKELAEKVHVFYGNDFVVGVKENTEDKIPKNFTLEQNYPNPFNPSTTIRYSIPQLSNSASSAETQWVTLKIYDLLGREVATLVNEKQSPGNYEVNFDANSIAGGLVSGVYFYTLRTGNISQTKKMILMK